MSYLTGQSLERGHAQWITPLICRLPEGDVRLTCPGEAGVNYALERASSLIDPNWTSLATNKASSGGMLVIINSPDTTVNNFWRIHSVP